MSTTQTQTGWRGPDDILPAVARELGTKSPAPTAGKGANRNNSTFSTAIVGALSSCWVAKLAAEADSRRRRKVIDLFVSVS